jgi:hypothetical protein
VFFYKIQAFSPCIGPPARRFRQTRLSSNFTLVFIVFELPPHSHDTAQSATLLLTLQLIGAGYVIPLNTVQAIKLEFARFLGFRETSTRFRQLETISEQALPCVDELVNLIDAYYLLDQPSSGRAGTEEDTSVSVGGIFTEMALAVITEIRDLLDLPMITQRNLISCMLIILNKHDLEHRSLQYLQNDMRQALRRLSVFLPGDVAVEVQQLALSVWAVSVRHWSHLMTPNLLEYVCVMGAGCTTH